MQSLDESAKVETLPVADVNAIPEPLLRAIHRTYPVVVPREDINDAAVLVMRSRLQRIATRLRAARKSRFPTAEILLSLTSIFGGAFLGALGNLGHSLSQPLFIVYFWGCPMATCNTPRKLGALLR